ncbi:hypothetical protein [Streptomyces sp. YIM 98790]|uniref:hypothetical protein n=1 Tax=Streptomyces sp. YIM 98790 TaxID=2689077 RepID=UPI001408E017|nr:hypothetical protein [Streptomyces sp. YIM 98790]
MGTADVATALIGVPRHRFVPARAWASPVDVPGGHWIDRDRDPEAWWQAVYSDTVIVTQLDEGRIELTEENAARWFWKPTCSASSPVLVAAFLRRLDPHPGDRVVEIGTGTGWTAGLLAQLTGDHARVTSVEIDPCLAELAERNLRACGLFPRLLTGDAARGLPGIAPYDRLHVTAGVDHLIPYAWVEQIRPGGTIVLPWNAVGRLVRLTVRPDGTAHGTFHEECGFMPLRGSATRRPGPARAGAGTGRLSAAARPPRERALDLDPAPLLAPEPGLQVLFDVLIGTPPWPAGEGRWMLSARGSSAEVADGRVTQSGPDDLWDRAEALFRAWRARDSPGLDRLGLTVTPHDQYVWLDDPAAPLRALLGAEQEPSP